MNVKSVLRSKIRFLDLPLTLYCNMIKHDKITKSFYCKWKLGCPVDIQGILKCNQAREVNWTEDAHSSLLDT